MKKPISILLSLLALQQSASAQYPTWAQSGSMFLLTTPDGADLPAGEELLDFPVLVRLERDWFDFKQAKADGSDLRFSSNGQPLSYQIDHWDATRGTAQIWVRLPRIKGHEHQEIKVHWGQPDALTESNAKAVFNESNGYLGVMHLSDPQLDAAGSLTLENSGTTPAVGIIGPARHFAGDQGISGGEKITNFPTGAAPHTSELWLRAEKVNGRALAWGNEESQGKVVMHFQSPPRISMDCYFSDANVTSQGRLPLNEWIHVVHTYQAGDSRIYINGVLNNASKEGRSPLNLKSPARLFIGGWYNHYDFVGDLDEVRLSKSARSAAWVKLEYENQKALQTLTGPLVPPGDSFNVSPESATVPEGTSTRFTAQAGGAQKVYWILKRDGQETLVATDRFSYNFEAGRITGDQTATLQFKAIYANAVKTRNIAIQLRENIEEPAFTLTAPTTWNGRDPIEITPQITNQAAMSAREAGHLKVEWNVGPFAVIKEITPGKLLLKRAQNSGQLSVTATLSNGGKPTSQTAVISVREPSADPWVQRLPAKDEKPLEGQFYARDDRNEGTLFYHGSLTAAADAVFLKLYAEGQLLTTATAVPAPDLSYALTAKLKPGLIRYKIEFGTITKGVEQVLQSTGNLVCGDAYLIDGQSNALATDTSEKSPPETNEWIRSYGRPSEGGTLAPENLWCYPVWKAEAGEKAELGWWGMELAKQLLASQKVPIFIINAAAGGTRIDQHQRIQANPTDLSTLYGKMLWRVQQARLTHGIRAILWHQGENDQGSDGPTGGYGWETWQPLFVEMSAAWKQDFPNVQHYYLFQIWPDSCSMGGRQGSGDMLREKQRTLPQLYSRMSIMSTLGIVPPGPCHFPLAGWGQFADLIQPLIERDFYGKTSATALTPANLLSASWATEAKDALVLEFDQPILWKDALAGQFYLDDAKDLIASGSVTGNVLTLKLKGATQASAITYLKESDWNQESLLEGSNGIAALTFCKVPITDPPGGRR
jgi:hypothetical protein